MDRRILYVVVTLLAVLGITALYEYNKPPSFYGAVIDPPKPMPDFTLQSPHGALKLSDFRGKYVALYFGYTFCPDICPTTLADLKLAVDTLDGQQAGGLQVIFISVDYKRDTPEKVDEYAKRFRSDFIGLGGSQAQIDQATRDFGIYYKLDDPDPATGSYAVEHTATILLLDRQGQLVTTWPYGQSPGEIASDLKIWLAK